MSGPDLLERGTALDAIGSGLDRALSGTPATVFIVGEAGLGKTALLRCGALDGVSHMALVEARGEAAEVALPFGYLAQATTGFSVSSLASTARMSPPERSVLAWQWLQAWVETFGSKAVLIVLDDLQWADPDSLALIRLLVRYPPCPRLAVLGSLRPWPTGAADIVAELAEAGLAEVVRLEPLSEAASIALVSRLRGAGVSEVSKDPVIRATIQHCGGNPLLLSQLANLAGDLEPPPPPGTLNAAPPLLLGRFTGLDSVGLDYARAAAICGVSFRPQIAAELAGLDERQGREALTALCAGGILEFSGTNFATFKHALLRQALYDDIAGPVRSQLHAAALRLLWKAGVPAGEAAAHAVAAGLDEDAVALAAVERAGVEAAAEGAFQAAARWLRAAVSMAGRRPRPEVRLRLAEATHAVGAPDETIALCRSVLGDRGIGASLEAGAYRLLARAQYDTGDVAGADRSLENAAAVAAEHDRRLAIEALLEGSLLGLWSSGPARSFHFAERAQHLLTATIDTQLVAWVETAVGHARMLMGDPGGVGQVCEALSTLPSGMGVRGLHGSTAWGPSMIRLQTAKITEHLQEALAAYRAAMDQARAESAPLSMNIYAVAHADTLARLGRLAEAREVMREAFNEAPWLASSSPWAWVGLAHLHYELDEPDISDDYCSRIEEAVGESGDGLPVMRLWLWRTKICLARDGGRPQEAASLVDRTVALAQRSGTKDPGIVPWHSLAIAVFLEVGREGHATAVIEELEDFSIREPQRRWPRAVAAMGRALLADTAGDVDGAEQHFEEAWAYYQELGMPLEEAEALVRYGSFLRRRRQPSRARGPLGRALQIAGACGARRLERIAMGELRIAGGRRRRSVQYPNLLSPMQEKIAALASQGLTNAEIGGRLFISARTVDHHLSHIYGVLGINSRRELPRSERVV